MGSVETITWLEKLEEQCTSGIQTSNLTDYDF